MSAFVGCTGLTKAEFASIESLCKIRYRSYHSNPLEYAHQLYINGQEVTDLVIPNSVTKIGYCAFDGCSGLKSVTIPESVTNIDIYA
ncbi:MAG: leucine-rich repeat protein, partial [Bacteroidaceae bacterium]|nr:leucine-rich repeat protein [Bacteroidaceae bacterium]